MEIRLSYFHRTFRKSNQLRSELRLKAYGKIALKESVQDLEPLQETKTS